MFVAEYAWKFYYNCLIVCFSNIGEMNFSDKNYEDIWMENSMVVKTDSQNIKLHLEGR